MILCAAGIVRLYYMKRIFAAVLAAVIMLSCFSVSALASTKTLLMLGDSIAAGTGLMDASTECYGAITAKANGWSFENCAVSGHTSFALEEMLERRSVRDSVSRADVICVSIGGNNYLQGGLPEILTQAASGNYSTVDKITEQFYGSFCRCLSAVKELNPDAVLIVQKLYNPRVDALRGVYQQGTDRLNAAFDRVLAENPGAYVILDVPSVINGHANYINVDTIHPNKYGHYEIACLLTGTLYDMGVGTASSPESSSKPNSLGFFEKIGRFFTQLFDFFRKLFN